MGISSDCILGLSIRKQSSLTCCKILLDIDFFHETLIHFITENSMINSLIMLLSKYITSFKIIKHFKAFNTHTEQIIQDTNRPYLESAIFEMCMISIFSLVSFERK